MNNPTDSLSWRKEAEAVVNDVKNHVNILTIAENLPNTNQSIFFNVETREKLRICVKLSGAGFQIVGNDFNSLDEGKDGFYETLQSLLSQVSPKFVESFGNELSSKLSELLGKSS